MNVDVVHVIAVWIGEVGEDWGRVVKDVAAVDEGDGGGGHGVVGRGGWEGEGEERMGKGIGGWAVIIRADRH